MKPLHYDGMRLQCVAS